MHAVMGELEDRYDRSEDQEEGGCELVSTGLHGIQISERGEDDGDCDTVEVNVLGLSCFRQLIIEQIVRDAWRSNWRSDITWLNARGPDELAVVHMAVGMLNIIT